MAENGRASARSLEKVASIIERLKARCSEIEQAIYARIQEAVPDPISGNDPEYQAGVRAAVTAVVGYSLEGIKHGPERSGPIPAAAVAQARRAARTGVSLGTILRRYVAGHGRLGEFIAEEAEHSGLSSGPALQHLHRTQETLLEHLTATIEYEYNQERELAAGLPEQRRAELVWRLLAGEPVDSAGLGYELHASWHLGVVATGAGAEAVLRGLKAGLSRQLLCVPCGEETVSAWLGGRRLAVKDIERLFSAKGTADVSLAIGEPGRGIDGWRLTHHQAQAAFGVSLCKSKRLTRYADCRLLAAALQNDTLTRSLKQRYLTPLVSQMDGGVKLRKTLRAYINAECNVTSAATPLEVGRHAVEKRLRTAEQLLGCPLRTCLAELDVALRLEELDELAALEDLSTTR
jgi:hypothetical protein